MDSPTHTISSRPVTPDDIKAIGLRRWYLSPDNWAWIFVGPGGIGFLGYIVGVGIAWLLGMGNGSASILKWILASVGSLAGMPLSIAMLGSFITLRRQATQDRRQGILQVIDVSNAVVIEEQPYNDEGPIYFLDIGNRKLLLLQGQWLYDWLFDFEKVRHLPHPEGMEEANSDQDVPFFTTHMRLHRTPSLGEVLLIELLGHVIPKPQIRLTYKETPDLAALCPSELLDGTLDNIPAAVADAAKKKKASDKENGSGIERASDRPS